MRFAVRLTALGLVLAMGLATGWAQARAGRRASAGHMVYLNVEALKNAEERHGEVLRGGYAALVDFCAKFG